MINISVVYFACYRHNLHTGKLNPLPSTFSTWLSRCTTADSAEATWT